MDVDGGSGWETSQNLGERVVWQCSENDKNTS